MDDITRAALNQGGICDITTTGAQSRQPRRIEIYFHHFDGSYYITGRPGFRRDWLANLVANPEFTVHLKQDVTVDVPAVAINITDEATRSEVLLRILTESWGTDPAEAEADLSRWVEGSPLVSFAVD